MNFNNWTGKKKALTLIGGLLLIIGLVVTIFLVQKVQEIRSRAEKATTLRFDPESQEARSGDQASVDVILNPGVNQVNFVKFKVKFDPDKIDPASVEFNPDINSVLQPIGSPVVDASGGVTFSLGVGDPTRVVRQQAKLGSVLFLVKEGLDSGEIQITFDETNSQARSIRGNADAFNENVLIKPTSIARLIIGGGVCEPNVATCSWDSADNATSYHYVVTDITDNGSSVIKEDDVDSDTTQIQFNSEPGHTYKCEVTSKNECGEASPAEGQSSCTLPSATPTPGETSTPTPRNTATPTPENTSTPTPKNTSTPTPSKTATPTPRDTSTPTPKNTSTPTLTPTNSPTPTTPQGGIESPTPTPTTPANEFVPTETPVPTLPPTGNPLVITGMIGGVLFLLGGIFLFFL